jgi:ribonucleoside-diphosphate reductase alpha chain
LEYTKAKLLSRQGGQLSPLDCHDIACMCGSIVQVGGVRRAAEISLSDLNDTEMRDCKQGVFWDKSVFRSMSNNSAVFEAKPSSADFLQEWLSLVKSGTGERGIFNRGQINHQIPSRRTKRDDWLTNPCGEIFLRPYGLCNLSVAVARPEDTFETLEQKVRLATIWGTLQSTLTNFQYVRPAWRQNAEEERLLGVDITGQWDCPLLLDDFSRWDILSDLRNTAIMTNAKFSELLGINPSVAVTCVKPSGNSSQLLDSSSGLHPRYSLFYIRRLRIGANAPIGKWLRDSGIPWHPEVGQSAEDMSVMVVDFPCKAPSGAFTRENVSAIDMLDYWRDWKLYYTEHNPSATIYVADDEWVEVGAWVYKNWEDIGGLTFLPKDGGTYTLAPYEEITEAQYQELVAKMPQLDFDALRRYETSDSTELNRDYACQGSCEL